jgi:hypothetical protein
MRWRRSGECRASHRSLRRCTFSQKSALLPNTRASFRAVSAAANSSQKGGVGRLSWRRSFLACPEFDVIGEVRYRRYPSWKLAPRYAGPFVLMAASSISRPLLGHSLRDLCDQLFDEHDPE